ncbi:MAG: DNA polymerase III subunit delta' [Ignavibacteriales bacterium]|nr:DNA polymerase III subunit delta' [Ignavibacteriales bacterium]
MSWESVIGQERVKDILIGSLKKNRLGHAYLFTGPGGSGKLNTALQLAKTLNCKNHNSDSCDECPSCKKFQTLQHPNLHLIFNLPVGKNETSNDPPLARLSPDDIREIQNQLAELSANHYYKLKIPKANAIKINSVRGIRREASLTMFGEGKKVFIVIDADKMNDAAANALLKTLEEPHEDTLIILITEMSDALLPTIVSRCQQIRFEPLSESIIADALVNQNQIDENEASKIAGISNGSYSKALLHLNNEYQIKQNQTLELIRIILLSSRAKITEEAERLAKELSKEELEETFMMMQSWFRGVMLQKEMVETKSQLGENSPEQKFIKTYPLWDYKKSYSLLERSILLLGKNVYIPLIIIDLALNLRSMVKAKKSK